MVDMQRFPEMAKKITPEAGVLRACLDLLAAEHCYAIRLNTGAIRNERGRLIQFHGAGPGCADILAFPMVNGRPHPLWLEVKAPTGQQSPGQVSFQEFIESIGHTYFVIRDSAELLAWLRHSVS